MAGLDQKCLLLASRAKLGRSRPGLVLREARICLLLHLVCAEKSARSGAPPAYFAAPRAHLRPVTGWRVVLLRTSVRRSQKKGGLPLYCPGGSVCAVSTECYGVSVPRLHPVGVTAAIGELSGGDRRHSRLTRKARSLAGWEEWTLYGAAVRIPVTRRSLADPFSSWYDHYVMWPRLYVISRRLQRPGSRSLPPATPHVSRSAPRQ